MDHEESSNEEIKCLWKDCGQEFNQVHELTSHLRDVHVGSGKVYIHIFWICYIDHAHSLLYIYTLAKLSM